MKKNIFLIILLLLSFKIISDEQNIFEIVNDISNYNFNPDTSIISRVTDPPDFIIAYFKRINFIDSYQKYNISDSDKKNVEKCIELLTENFKSILKNNVIGIYFMTNIKASGFAKYIKDRHNNKHYIIVINSDYLNKNISDWISLKENTCFIDDNKDYSIKINIEGDYFAFFYILVHELSHAFGTINGIIPQNPSSIKDINILKNIPFMKETWLNYYKPTKENNFKSRYYVSYYGKNNGPKLKKTKSLEVYNQLKDTSFVSLYSSIDCNEDLAELFTIYFFTQKLNLDYNITVQEKNNIIFSYEPVKNEKIINRFKIIENYFK